MAATAIIMNKSQVSTWSRLILSQLVVLKESPFTISKSHQCLNHSYPTFSTSSHSFPIPKSPKTSPTTISTTRHFLEKLSFPNSHHHLGFAYSGNRFFSSARTIQELLADVEREKQKEREERKRAGLDAADIDAEDEEDYMGVGPLIEKLEKEKLKDTGDLNRYEEPTDSESEDDERFTPDAIKKRTDEFEKKFKRHEELLKNFAEAVLGRDL